MPLTSLEEGLPETVFEILNSLYTLFDFWELPKRIVEEELLELRKHNYR